MLVIENQATGSRSDSTGTVVWVAMATMAGALILPNFFLLSFDDISIQARLNPLSHIGPEQATNGRFSFALLTYISSQIGLTYPSFVALSISSFVIGMVACFESLLRLSGVSLSPLERVVFFGLFATFGFFLDLYQFTFASACYAANLIATVISLIVVTSNRSGLAKVVLIGAIGCVALGFYQLYPAFMLGACLAYVFLKLATDAEADDCVDKVRAVALLTSLGVFAALVSYFAVNAMLKFSGATWMSAYPSRKMTASAMVSNLPDYGFAALAILNPFSQSYGFFNSPLLHLSVAVAICALAFSIAMRSRRAHFYVFVVALAVLFVASPNPLNLPLEVFWPSPRSISFLALPIVGLLLGGYLVAKEGLGVRGQAIFFAPAMLLLVQFAGIAQLYAERYKTHQSDIAFATTIIHHAYQSFAPGEPVKVRWYTTWNNVGLLGPFSHDYGGSLFGSSYAGNGLISTFSGRSIDVGMAEASVCAQAPKRLWMLRHGDTMVACFARN